VRIARFAFVVLALAVIAGDSVAGRVFRPGGGEISIKTTVVLQSWVDAVHAHVPGRADNAVATIGDLISHVWLMKAVLLSAGAARCSVST
jgi:hypothetical protein